MLHVGDHKTTCLHSVQGRRGSVSEQRRYSVDLPAAHMLQTTISLSARKCTSNFFQLLKHLYCAQLLSQYLGKVLHPHYVTL